MRTLPLLLLTLTFGAQAATLPADIDPQSLSRLPFVTRSSLDAEGKRIFDAINTAVTGKQEELPRMGPPASSMYSIAVAEPYDKINQLLRKTVVGPAYFEICTLLAAREYDQEYEWASHEPAAKRAGVGDATIDAIRYNRSADGLPEKDRVVIQFGRQLLTQHKLDSTLYAKVVELFGKQGMIELTMSLGDYVMTAILLNAVDQHVPAGREVNLPPEVMFDGQSTMKSASTRFRRILVMAGALVFAGCSTLAVRNLDALFGAETAKEFVPVQSALIEYHRDIKPIMEQRCLVCHGCYDAPCQLKLDSIEGILRGGTKDQVYNSARLTQGTLSRMFEDAQTTAAWRARNFHAVLNERENSPQANLQAGLIARMLDLKTQHPLTQEKTLPATFDLSLGRAEQCPKIEDFDSFAGQFPQWGMPYGLPAISTDENRTLLDWLSAGAPSAAIVPLNASLAQEVDYWELLFNGDSLKHRLAARYLYEHLFLAHLYLEDAGAKTVFFRLVRSRTPPGQPLDVIATRRPYDDPGVERVYYRLWRDPASVVAKTHMPYRLSPARRDKWKEWFIDPDYSVTQLPGYDAKTAANPFITYDPIPYISRHSFLLDEAQFTVMNFIKGPVCRGNVALNVIQDRFWVFFTSPHSGLSEQFSTFLAGQDQHLRLPAEAESGLWSIAFWRSYARSQKAYLQAKGEFLRTNARELERAQLGLFWDGDRVNANAALTVFRHFDSATVVQGLVGEQPQTAWLIDYPILERVHYLLVAGFDVYGTASHQAMTRMYMDFLRMESEMNFVSFLPEAQRGLEVDNWYRDAESSVEEYLNAYFENEALPPPYDYQTTQYKQELFTALQQRVADAANDSHDLSRSGLPDASITELDKLNRVSGVPASIMPQGVIIKVQGHGLLTLLSNSAYTNISSMFGEAERRLVTEDTLTIANGVLTAYPNVFLQVSPAQIPELVQSISSLRSEADYSQLLDRYGVRRTHPQFWSVSDQVMNDYRISEPVSSGVLDYNRYDNR